MLLSFSGQIIKFILNIILLTYSKIKELFRSTTFNLNDSLEKIQIMSKNNSSLFKFKKIDFTTNQDYPNRRSGHRAVFNESDDSFYIWGGYYPEESIIARETKFNLYPEVRLIF